MKDYYEELWRNLPAELAPPDWEVRRQFLIRELAAGDHVLDLGCGQADFTAEIARAGARVVGVDVAEAALERGHARHPDLDLRLTPVEGPLPFPDATFGVVWASEVIEHVTDTARWLSEVRRVLVPGGRVLLTTPAHGRLRVLAGGMARFSEPLGDHLHLYTRGSLKQVLLEFGFGQVQVRTAGGAPLLRRLLLARASR